ncbi:MAG: beta-ketoacyl-ACP synthase II [Alphaproteobacteria bacterium]|nr:MAG: beta-ketoacyl-ACP synthase II [Alphaproteobacteria bacterium]
MRRVVVTGLGAVTPLGGTISASWDSLIAGKSGIRTVTEFPVDDLPCHIAGMVPHGDSAIGLFNPDDWMTAGERKRTDPFIVYAIAAATQAIEDSGWKPTDTQQCERTGVLIGSGIGGLQRLYDTSVDLHEKGPRYVSPFFLPAILINLASGQVSIKYGFKGPNHAVGTACATGTHAIGDAARLIAYGDADVMVAGGAEAAVCRIGLAGFSACRALSTTYNNTPTEASRPWDKGRDGFVMGEGAGILVLEEYDHAKKRGAKIYGEVVGYGLSGDAHHITAPASDGDGGYRAMKAALKSIKNHTALPAQDIDYINAHGTSTPLGDVIEALAITRLLGASAPQTSISSTKSAVGHLLGGAGGVEAVFTVMALYTNVCPPTLNLHTPADECAHLDLTPHTAKDRGISLAMSNSFGFGGTNASLVFAKV